MSLGSAGLLGSIWASIESSDCGAPIFFSHFMV
jgi:hypothetical protein